MDPLLHPARTAGLLGIQRVQRELPSGRNPFTHYKRVIISVDTLKNIGRYRHHLERIRWDAVVIDESHNLINPGSQRRALAEILAPRTDALLLASATPHNGDKRSFADLISLLDPGRHRRPRPLRPGRGPGPLYIRRTKISPEVRDEMGTEWPDRGPTVSLHCAATEAEERVFAELAEHWIPTTQASTEFGTAAQDPVSVAVEPVFAYNLLKTFLSSHKALGETVTNRVASSRTGSARPRRRGTCPTPPSPPSRPRSPGSGRSRRRHGRRHRSRRLRQARRTRRPAEEEIGVGPSVHHTGRRLLERVRTLTWLADVVPARLGLPVGADGTSKAVAVMHGGLSDEEQARVLSRSASPTPPYGSCSPATSPPRASTCTASATTSSTTTSPGP